MTKFTLNVRIDPTQVAAMKKYDYKLCICKKVDGKYTVVWDGDRFFVDNKFEWEDEYRIYTLDAPPTGPIQPGVGQVPIAPGQSVTISRTGKISTATGPKDGTNFHIINNYKPVHIALEQKFNGGYRPVWVDPSAMFIGSESVTPIPAVMLFFSRKLETSSLIVDIQSSALEVPFRGTTKHNVSFTADPQKPENGLWHILEGQTSRTSLPTGYSHSNGFTPLPYAFDVGSIVGIYTLSKAGAESTETAEVPKAIEPKDVVPKAKAIEAQLSEAIDAKLTT